MIAGLIVIVTVWSGATLSSDPTALAKVELQPFAGTLVGAKAFGPDGRSIPVAVRDGRLTPLQQITPGEFTRSVGRAIADRPGFDQIAQGMGGLMSPPGLARLGAGERAARATDAPRSGRARQQPMVDGRTGIAGQGALRSTGEHRRLR